MPPAPINTDFIYWTFTAAAQCVSTFVALLLTGYALVLSQIETARERDDSLEELHHQLRKGYHTRLTLLAWMTAIAVVMSLVVVWVNRNAEPPPDSLMAVAAVMDLIAIVVGLAFVVTIIDPDKYQKAAERALEQQLPKDADRRVTPATEFFRAYRKLEKAMRELVEKNELTTEDDALNRAGTMRRMADMLVQTEVIDDELFTELGQISQYRNLLFHGEVKEADFGMVERARGATARLRQLGPDNRLSEPDPVRPGPNRSGHRARAQ